jgi:hypothetical protein
MTDVRFGNVVLLLSVERRYRFVDDREIGESMDMKKGVSSPL